VATVVITITDLPEGNRVNIVSNPSAETLFKEMAAKEGRGVPASHIYALRALRSIIELNKIAGSERIITKLPKLGL
jgi:hypothetical protein